MNAQPSRAGAAPATPAAASHGRRALQFLRITLGQHPYAIRIDVVREILEKTQVTPVPLMPPFIRGVMNLRGAVVPVIDLGVRVGAGPASPGRRHCMIIADIGDADDGTHTLGMLVDAVHEVFDHDEAELEPVPRLGTRVAAGFIRSMLRLRGESTPELDLEQALGRPALAGLIGVDPDAGHAHGH